jgi:nicotinate-nucleotide adenylyltransferase
MTEPIGIFGGTFDPIHYGHLRTAFELLQALKLSQVRFLPTGNPPHREDALAPSALRLEMVRAAVAGQAGFSVDDREIRRSGVSYSIDTLTDLRGEFPQRSLCLLLGMDAFLGMPTWHRWREIFDRGTGSVRDLHSSAAGRIYVRAVTQLEIASTDLRALIMSGQDPRYLVPDEVRNLIAHSGCYAARNRQGG